MVFLHLQLFLQICFIDLFIHHSLGAAKDPIDQEQGNELNDDQQRA